MTHYLIVAVGGALGAVARYGCYRLALKHEWHAAVATLGINALGSLLIGVLYVVLTERSGLSPQLQSLLTVGFLGAFTTYSTYSLDALKLLEQGQPLAAVAYLLGTLLLCLMAVWLGASAARLV
ncbi:MAG: fluoride efflux transporter CrcB [Pseudohongiellaceae bacterium]